MASWSEFDAAEPEFAARVRAILDAQKNKVLATLRRDGAPRISGIEVEFADGQLTFGSMPGARKGADLRRDPRCALHSGTVDRPDEFPGDAKIAGRAVSTGPLSGEIPGDGFRVELEEVVVIGLNEAGDRLRIDSWHPGRGLRRVERE